jgi:uroporphyrin-III C-methyltransferase
VTVHLVGAGPGDPELLTVKAARLIGRADSILHDRLVHPDILTLAPPWAEVVDVGKRPGGPREAQARIHDLLLDHGRRHETVVRLKGGDPFVFGRGGEEAEICLAAGIPVEIVPGISAAIAAPAAAGIPVTMRHRSSGFTVVTAHQDPSTEEWLDWEALARLGTTLVVLMGAATAGRIAERLREAGMRPDTPVAVIRAATRPDQQIVRTDLAGLVTTPVEPPSTIVIGAVADARLNELATTSTGGPAWLT